MQVLRLRDVPNLFYTLKDELDPITIPDKYWRTLSDSISCEYYHAEGTEPPPGTPSRGYESGDPERPMLEPNTDYMFRYVKTLLGYFGGFSVGMHSTRNAHQ